MASSIFDQWSQTHKVSLAPIFELNDITTRLCGTICRQNLEVMNRIAQSSQEQLQGLAQVKSIDGAVQSQTRWFAVATPQMFQHAEEVLNTLMDSATEYQTWFESNLQLMNQERKAYTERK